MFNYLETKEDEKKYENWFRRLFFYPRNSFAIRGARPKCSIIDCIKYYESYGDKETYHDFK